MAYGLLIIRYRRPIEEIQAATPAHRAYLTSLVEARTIVASGPMDPRFGGVLLARIPDDDPQGALERIRDSDPFWQGGFANYELVVWNLTFGRDGLDRL